MTRIQMMMRMVRWGVRMTRIRRERCESSLMRTIIRRSSSRRLWSWRGSWSPSLIRVGPRKWWIRGLRLMRTRQTAPTQSPTKQTSLRRHCRRCWLRRSSRCRRRSSSMRTWRIRRWGRRRGWGSWIGLNRKMKRRKESLSSARLSSERAI